MKPSFILEECGQKQRKAGDQTIIIISPCSCVWSSNKKHWAGTRGDGRSLRTGISQKLSHERQTWNQRRKITRKLVKSFTCWVKTRMVEKRAHQHICQLHPVDPENEFSARKKKVSPHFSRIQSQCLQPKACRRLSGSIRNFPVGLQETRCLKRWPPKMAERNRCSFKGHGWVWVRVYLIGRWNNQHIQAMLWSLPTSIKGLECNNSTGWVDLLIIWCFNFSWTMSSTWMWLADNLQVYLMPVFSTPSYLFDNQSSPEWK